jgi:hypothetical protein
MCLVHALAALATLGCLPDAKEPSHCQEAPLDAQIAAVLAECRVEVAAAPNATEKAHARKACLAELDALEASCGGSQ